jgi:DNA-binding CsgD family transcriptional regulator
VVTSAQILRAQRNVELVRLRNEGMSPEEIALQVKLSPERVRQILQEFESREYEPQSDSKNPLELSLEILRLRDEGQSLDEIAQEFALSLRSVREILVITDGRGSFTSMAQVRTVIRDAEILKLLDEGRPLREIARQIALPPGRIRQVLGNLGKSIPEQQPPFSREKRTEFLQRNRQLVRELQDLEPGLDAIGISRRLNLTTSDVRQLQKQIEMVRRRSEGQTLEQISQHFGVSRERVRQILRQAGGPSANDLRERRAAEREAAEVVDRERLIVLLESEPGLSMQEVSERLELRVTDIRRLAPSHARRLIADYGVTKSSTQRWSDADILGAIQHASTYEFPLSASTFGQLVTRGEVVGPSVPLVYMRFGSWTSACTAAGVESGTSFIESYESRWTDDDLLGFVCAYLMIGNSAGTFSGYDIWAKQEGHDAPSAGTIRVRLGPWGGVKKRALQLRAETSRKVAGD